MQIHDSALTLTHLALFQEGQKPPIDSIFSKTSTDMDVSVASAVHIIASQLLQPTPRGALPSAVMIVGGIDESGSHLYQVLYSICYCIIISLLVIVSCISCSYAAVLTIYVGYFHGCCC